MINIPGLPQELPSRESTFFLEVEGSTTKFKYRGEFKLRVPNLKAKALAEKRRAELNGPQGELLDVTIQVFHSQIAYLAYTIQEAPKWWTLCEYGYALDDYNVVSTLYDAVRDLEEGWSKTIWGYQEGQNNGESERKA